MSDPARFAALMLLAAPLAGCAIGPNYERPEVAEPEEYRGQVGPAEAASLADLPWWEVFSDPALQELLREALAEIQRILDKQETEQCEYEGSANWRIVKVVKDKILPLAALLPDVNNGEDKPERAKCSTTGCNRAAVYERGISSDLILSCDEHVVHPPATKEPK